LNWEISYCLARSFHWRHYQLAFVLNENELWLVMKALGSRPDTSQVGAIFDAANIGFRDQDSRLTAKL
jgi:hypothetical protein